MLQHGHGYPLYTPDPDPGHSSTGVRVGDIGRVTSDGIFDFLFNVVHGPPPLPDNLELLVLQNFQDGDDVTSEHVKQTEDSLVIYSCIAKLKF